MEAAQEGHLELVKYLHILLFKLIVLLYHVILRACKHVISHGFICCLCIKVV
jgi:hypothetical protein